MRRSAGWLGSRDVAPREREKKREEVRGEETYEVEEECEGVTVK